jgi:hypothetical protein
LLDNDEGELTMKWLMAVALMVLVPSLADAQETRRPAAERSSEPNYGTRPDSGTGPGGQEIRAGSPDGDSPSASAGRIAKGPVERRILGLPVNAVLVIAAVILGLVALAGTVIPSSRRRRSRPRLQPRQ